MKVLVGLSGGVDSAVAAFLAQQRGQQVSACFMKNWDDDDGSSECTAGEDFLAATQVAQHLDIPLQSVNFARQYKERVFADFLRNLSMGNTPNPDILCNSEIKFATFAEYAMNEGVDTVVTGHYARVVEDDGKWMLLSGIDSNKDQSYFLYRLTQQQLSRSCFPLGTYTKTAVRQLAQKIGLPNHARKDSTGICFIGERDFRAFVSRYLPVSPGDIVDENGKVIGSHCGASLYTIGQRKGLGIGGRTVSSNPWYIVEKDIHNNRLTAVQGSMNPLLYSDSATITQLHWIGDVPALPWQCTVKLRYRQVAQPCTVIQAAGDAVQLCFASRQRAVTPGQSAVFYHNDICMGGGIITKMGNRNEVTVTS